MNDLPTEIAGLSTEIIAQGHIEFTKNSVSSTGFFQAWNEMCINKLVLAQYPPVLVVITVSSFRPALPVPHFSL